MKMNSPYLMFCPLEQEFVMTSEQCVHCLFWDGQECMVASSGLRKRRGYGPTLRRIQRRLTKKRPPRRGGRGIRVPAVWEQWPRGEAGKEQAMFGSDEGQMASEPPDAPVAGSQVPEQFPEVQDGQNPGLDQGGLSEGAAAPEGDPGVGGVIPEIPVEATLPLAEPSIPDQPPEVPGLPDTGPAPPGADDLPEPPETGPRGELP